MYNHKIIPIISIYFGTQNKLKEERSRGTVDGPKKVETTLDSVINVGAYQFLKKNLKKKKN